MEPPQQHSIKKAPFTDRPVPPPGQRRPWYWPFVALFLVSLALTFIDAVIVARLKAMNGRVGYDVEGRPEAPAGQAGRSR